MRSHTSGYGHFSIVVGITAASVDIEPAMTHAPDSALDAGARAALCGGVATFQIALTAAQWATSRSMPTATIAARGPAVTALFLLTLIGGVVNPAVLAVVRIAILGPLTAFEIRIVPAGRPRSPRATDRQGEPRRA